MKKFISIVIVFVVWCVFWAAPLLFNNDTQQYLPERDFGYTIEDYDVEIIVSDDKSMFITETITANFSEYSHGISRYLPLKQTIKYFDENNKLVSITYKNEISDFKYNHLSSSDDTRLVSTEEYGGYVFYRMGQSDYILGEQTYSFSYVFDIGDDRIADKDLIYFNIIGTGWDTTIKNVDFNVTFSSNIDESGFKFYVGQYGADQSGDSSRVTATFGEKSISGSVQNLDYGEALTIYKEFEENFFNIPRNFGLDILLLVLVILVVAGIVLFYYFNRRKTPIVEAVEFSAPNNLTPTEVGYINDKKLTGDEISALIVYWASKGNVKLKQEGEDVVKITKLKALPNDAKEHEKLFFNSLFSGRKEVLSDNLNLSDASAGYKIESSIKQSCANCFKNKVDWLFGLVGLFVVAVFSFVVVKDFLQAHIGSWTLIGEIVSVAAICVGLILYPNCIKQKVKWSKKKFLCCTILDILLILAGAVALMFLVEPYSDAFGGRFYVISLLFAFLWVYPKIELYTEVGREYLGKIRGLKNYILVAEKDRIDFLVNENPDLFFEILPYAYVLGVSDEYMKMFEDLNIIQPSWYECDSFTSAYFALHMFRSLNFIGFSIRSSMINHTVTKTLSTISTIGGGGSGGSSGGGGGFSGGGSGGGGGGRW